MPKISELMVWNSSIKDWEPLKVNKSLGYENIFPDFVGEGYCLQIAFIFSEADGDAIAIELRNILAERYGDKFVDMNEGCNVEMSFENSICFAKIKMDHILDIYEKIGEIFHTLSGSNLGICIAKNILKERNGLEEMFSDLGMEDARGAARYVAAKIKPSIENWEQAWRDTNAEVRIVCILPEAAFNLLSSAYAFFLPKENGYVKYAAKTGLPSWAKNCFVDEETNLDQYYDNVKKKLEDVFMKEYVGEEYNNFWEEYDSEIRKEYLKNINRILDIREKKTKEPKKKLEIEAIASYKSQNLSKSSPKGTVPESEGSTLYERKKLNRSKSR